MQTCDKYNIYRWHSTCVRLLKPVCKCRIKSRPECGIDDSVKYVLNTSHDILFINDLLSPF